jgi:AcrR family transcriptional regulator
VLKARGRRTRARLVAAAKQVFEEIPFADARIADITAGAGMSTGAFYTYFDSKEAIFREVAAEVLAEMAAAPRRDPDNVEGDPIRDIAYASRQYFLTCLGNAGIARSIEQLKDRDSEIGESRHRTLVHGVKGVERWIRRLQDDGVCDTDIGPWTMATVLHTMNVRVAYDLLLSPAVTELDEADRMRRVDELVDTVTHVWARTVGLERVEPTRAKVPQPEPVQARSAS